MLNISQALNILIGKTNASQQCSNCNHNILQKRGIKEGRRRRSRKDLWWTGLAAEQQWAAPVVALGCGGYALRRGVARRLCKTVTRWRCMVVRTREMDEEEAKQQDQGGDVGEEGDCHAVQGEG